MADNKKRDPFQDIDIPEYVAEPILKAAANVSGKPAEDLTLKQAMEILQGDDSNPVVNTLAKRGQEFANEMLNDMTEEQEAQLIESVKDGTFYDFFAKTAQDFINNNTELFHQEIEKTIKEALLPNNDINTAIEQVTNALGKAAEANMQPPAREFYKSEEWQEKRRRVKALIKELTDISPEWLETARDVNIHKTYLAEELKKPKYKGKSIDDLFEIADLNDDGSPKESSLFMQAMNAAREAREKDNGKTQLRTAQRAGDISRVLKGRLAIVTLSGYQNAVSLLDTGNAYLRATDVNALAFDNGKLYFMGDPIRSISEVELKNLQTKEDIENINLPFLQWLYTLIFSEWETTIREQATGQGDGKIQVIKEFYLPDLAKARGLPTNASNESMEAIKNDITALHNVVGVLKEKGYKEPSYYPVLNFEGYDATKNTIAISSPYLMHVVEAVFSKAVRRAKDGTAKLKKDGTPQMKAANSYLVHSSIQKERNKAAVQNVFLIVQGIESRGGKRGKLNTYHIKATTLIERNILLKERLNKNKNKRRILQTCFKKTWELLKTKTDLELYYPGIKLPNPENPADIPTYKGLSDFVIRIPHYGKEHEPKTKSSE